MVKLLRVKLKDHLTTENPVADAGETEGQRKPSYERLAVDV